MFQTNPCSSCIYSNNCNTGVLCNSFVSREDILDDFIERSLSEIDKAEYVDAYLEYIDENNE